MNAKAVCTCLFERVRNLNLIHQGQSFRTDACTRLAVVAGTL